MMTMLVGCTAFKRNTLVIPQYQELQVVHPAPLAPLSLTDVDFEVWSLQDLKHEADAPTVIGGVYYVLDRQSLNSLLNNDISKLEYVQYEHMRAEFYKNAIEQYNIKIKNRNKSSDK